MPRVRNVSGGCVEGAVYERCLEAIDSGAVSVDSFGYSDGEASPRASPAGERSTCSCARVARRRRGGQLALLAERMPPASPPASVS
jgi:xanthine dehydrogenase accessory factor